MAILPINLPLQIALIHWKSLVYNKVVDTTYYTIGVRGF